LQPSIICIKIIDIAFPRWFWMIIVIFCVTISLIVRIDVICVSSFLLVFAVDCIIVAVCSVSCFVRFRSCFLGSQLGVWVYSVRITRRVIVASIENVRKDFELLRERFLGVLLEKTAHLWIKIDENKRIEKNNTISLYLSLIFSPYLTSFLPPFLFLSAMFTMLIDVCLILLILQMMQEFGCIFFKFICIFTEICTKQLSDDLFCSHRSSLLIVFVF